MVPCLGEPPRWVLWCWLSFLVFISFLCLHFVVVLYLSFLFISFPAYFTMSPALHPGFSDLWRRPPSLSSTLNYFWLPFLFHLPQALRFWVGSFYTQAFFTLRFFIEILTNIYQGFPGTQQFFLDVCRALYWSWKHGPGLSVCLIHSNPQTLYISNLYLYMPILQLFSMWWKLWWKI